MLWMPIGLKVLGSKSVSAVLKKYYFSWAVYDIGWITTLFCLISFCILPRGNLYHYKIACPSVGCIQHLLVFIIFSKFCFHCSDRTLSSLALYWNATVLPLGVASFSKRWRCVYVGKREDYKFGFHSSEEASRAVISH